MKPSVLAALPMATVLVWIGALILEPSPYAQGSVLLVGLGWLILATVGTVGLVLVGGRWAHYTLISVMASTLLVAAIRPLDTISITGLAGSAGSLVFLLAPGGTRMVRKLPSAAGPPPESVLVTALALSGPLVLGLIPTEPDGAVFVFAFAGVAAALLYSRTIPGGLFAMRYGVAVVAAATLFFMPFPHAIAAAALGLAITVIAWSSQVAVAFRPLIERGTPYAIPPELAPREVLDSARIDDSGSPI